LKFHFHRTISAFRAEGVVRESIHRFKYNREMYFGAHLANWITDVATRSLDWSEIDAIVPVPLFPRKQRSREFNQAAYLAVAVSRSSGVPLIDGKLRRVKETVTQTALNAKERAANLRGAFAVKTPEAFDSKRLALVDDVFTTGATLDGCAKVLLQSGAREVTALTVARGV
jgi:ComF family protein